MADKEVTVKITTETDISPLEELDEKIEEIQDKSTDMQMDVEVEDSSVDDATSKTEELESELENIDGMTVTPEVDTSSLENAQATAEETVSSMDSIATAAVGISATAGFEEMAATADRINTSWNRLDLTFEGTGVSMDALRSQTSALSASTGRAGGVIRDYFNQMGIAGVTNTQLLSDSFEALAGKSYQTGQSIESMEAKMQTMVLTGNASNRMLKTLGLSAEDLAAAMGVSADQVNEAFKNMTPEERLQAITTAMGDGARANEMYKNSYEGLKTQAEAAMAGLMGAIGQAILPIVVPALQAATTAIQWLTTGFQALPGPVQAIIGAVGGGIAIFTALVGVLGIVGSVISTVQSGLAALRSIQLVSTIATKAAAAAQWLWNAALSANPIGILIIAIAALIAILAYLYFNNEQVREAIDAFGQSVMAVAGIIWDTLVAAFNNLSSAFQNFTSQLGLNTNDWTQAILGFILFLPQLPARISLALLDAITQTLGFGDSFVEALWSAATGAVDSFRSGIAGLSDALKEELQEMLSAVADFYDSLPPGLMSVAGSMVLNWLAGSGEGSPGFMYDALEGELTAMVELPGQILGGLISSIGEFAMMMVQAFSFESVIGALTGLWSAIDGLWQYITEVTTMIPLQVSMSVSQIIAGVMQALAYIATLPGQVGAYLNSVISRVLSFASSFVSNIRNAASNAVSQFSSVIHGLGSALASELSNMISQAVSFASNLASTLYNAGANAVSSFLSGMGAGSPGTMQRFLVWELNEMGRRTPLESKNLVQNIGKLGADVVDSFGQPDLSLGNVSGNGYGVGGVAVGGDTVINIYGDVDSDKRVTEIIDAVRRELNWNNTTAGRTI